MKKFVHYSLFTIHYSLLAKLASGGILIVLSFSFPPGVAAASQESPLIVDADQVVYDEATQVMEATGNVRLRYRGLRLSADLAIFDLQREHLTARGRVVLIDAQGRELRGDVLTYDVRLERAEMARAETIVDRVYVRSERIQTQRNRITGDATTVTTCNPERPAYRVTASSVEVTPGERLVARRASLWLGSLRVLTLPVLVLSLRSPEETARGLPRIGYNNVDGFWIDYVYGYRFGALPGGVHTKYGTRSGFITRNTLQYASGPFTAAFTLGRNQDVELRLFDQAELSVGLVEQPLGWLPLLGSVSVAGGWFRETATGVETTRSQYQVGLRTASIPLGPRTSSFVAVSWLDAFYGNSNRQGVLRLNAAITHQIDARRSLSLGYGLVEVYGATPFQFDSIATKDRIHNVALQYSLSGARAVGIATSFNIGPVYNFRDATTSLAVGYAERATGRFHWGLGVEYNLSTQAMKLTTDTGLAIGGSTYITVQAIYHTDTQAFEDLDFILSTRFCDCISLSLKYRQVRQEIFLEIGLTAAPETRLQFQFPRP